MPRKAALAPLRRLTYSVADIAVLFGVHYETALRMVKEEWFGDSDTFPRTPGGKKMLVPAGPVEQYAAWAAGRAELPAAALPAAAS